MVRRKRNKQKPALDITNRKMDHFTWTRNYSFNDFGINTMLINTKLNHISLYFSTIFEA